MPKVLLIDDSPTIQKVASLILKGGPYRLLSAANSDKGMAVAMKEKPDIALVDLTIGPINGLDLIQQFSNHPDLGGMKTALLYGHFKKVDEAALKAAGAAAQLAKPFDARDFLSVLETLTNARAQNISSLSQTKPEPQLEDKSEAFKAFFDDEELEECLNFLVKPLTPPKKKEPVSIIQAENTASAKSVLPETAPREVIEKICWEVIPPLAERIIREEIQRLLKESN